MYGAHPDSLILETLLILASSLAELKPCSVWGSHQQQETSCSALAGVGVQDRAGFPPPVSKITHSLYRSTLEMCVPWETDSGGLWSSAVQKWTALCLREGKVSTFGGRLKAPC